MDIKREPVIDAGGRHRGYKLWILCPHCEGGRWVREDATRKIGFSGFCNKCHAQYTTGQYENHSNWKGGRIVNGGGYVEIKLQPDDPYYPMARKSGYVREHRLIMAKYLGRCLKPGEVVHHKNEDKGDNRIENLELIQTGILHLLDANFKGIITRWDESKKVKHD